METYWQAKYDELAKMRSNMGAAYVRDYWQGGYEFVAYPRQGDWVVECRGSDLPALIEKAKVWLTGKSPEGFYMASLC